MSIRIQSVSKQFGTFKALENIHLSIEKGEFIALLGPSGSGKTTLLRTIAGLETPDSGEIHFENADVTKVAAQDRGIGFIFQHYALFRHMSVFENIAFGLRVLPEKERPSETEISHKVMELLKLIQLDWLKDRFPHQLSGGQKQRVALARTLAVNPQVLLLDEPFGALDTNIRKELRSWLRNLHDTLNMTSIFVTHDVDEALEMADRVVVMNHGKIIQVGTPEEIYHRPADAFVYKFIGDVHLFHARESDTTKEALVRPSALSIHQKKTSETDFEAHVHSIKHIGHAVKVSVKNTKGETIEIPLSPQTPILNTLKKGESIFVSIDTRNMFLSDYQI